MPQKLKCIVCGYTEIADSPPERCPVCRAESDRFNAVQHAPDWLDVKPMIDTIHIADSTSISSSEKYLSSFGMSAENLILQSGETVDDFSLERDSILIVLEGEALVNSDNPIELLDADKPDHSENSDNELKVNQEENIEERKDKGPDLFSEVARGNADDPQLKSEDSDIINPQLTENIIRKHHAVFLPGSTGLSIRNTGESKLILLIIH